VSSIHVSVAYRLAFAGAIGLIAASTVADAPAGADGLVDSFPSVRPSPPLGLDPDPYTIGRGRLAFEIGLIEFAYDRWNTERDNTRTTRLSWPVLMKYGLTDTLDIQIGADWLVTERVRDRDADERTRITGSGETVVRAKWNLLGNFGADEGEFALALLPELVLPTARSGIGNTRGVEGGLHVPMTWHLSRELSERLDPILGLDLGIDLELGWVPGFLALRNSDDDGYQFGFNSLVNLVGPIVDDLEWVLEFEATLFSGSDPWEGVINAGVIWTIHDDLVLETGITPGVTRSADDIAFYATLKKRF